MNWKLYTLSNIPTFNMPHHLFCNSWCTYSELDTYKLNWEDRNVAPNRKNSLYLLCSCCFLQTVFSHWWRRPTYFYCETNKPNPAYCMTLSSQINIPTLALQMKHIHHQTVWGEISVVLSMVPCFHKYHTLMNL
jgi:hypothetical protein